MTGRPDVSVIVAVYNTMPYLDRCLASLVGQSIGADRMEIVAVDDGSTDGSPKCLDRYARRYPGLVTLIRQPNSGGPAAPSNRGLDRARGRYVFFVGADDYLGQQALQRMVAAADEYDSDVVLGKMIGVNWRVVPRDIFAISRSNIGLYDSPLPYALSNTKLFRRELIDRYGLRFPEDLPVGSDQPFTLEACVRAKRITVLADYDYYFAVRRRNTSNLTYQRSLEELLRCTEEIMKVTANLVEPGPRRDAINQRHFDLELSRLLRLPFLALDRDAQERVCAGIARLAYEHLTDPVRDRLEVAKRVRLSLAQHGHLDQLVAAIEFDASGDAPPLVTEDSRRYAAYPGFRDGTCPDAWFEVTDRPAEALSFLLRVADVTWSRGGLTVTLDPPADLAGQSVWLRVGEVRAEAEPGSAGRSVVLPAESLLLGAGPEGGRRVVFVQLVADDVRYDVALRLPSRVGVRASVAWHAGRPYRINPARTGEGLFALDVGPVTAHKVIGRLRRALRRPGR